MSIATEISRIQTDRNTIRNKLINLGLADSTDNLDDLATAINGIANQGAVSAEVQEGDTYTIPAGYHNVSGTGSGVAGGGNYQLQSKGPITPTKSAISVAPDQGYYGLSGVSIAAIPAAYQDVTSVTATAGDVLATKVIVESDGSVTAGTMTNNGAVSATLDTSTTSYTVPQGYHNGSGTVSLTTETKSATPTTSSQDITPTTGKVLSKVTVNAIPSNYGDATGMTATESHILYGDTAIGVDNGDAVVLTGSMPNNGTVTKTLDATTGNQSFSIAQGYHSGSGSVSITLETKTATPSTSTQNITPANGKVLSKVTVNPIPSNYGNATGMTATAANILYGQTAIGINNGSAVTLTGSMTNNGAISATIDGLTTTSYTVPAGYHNGSGTVSLTNDIETALAAI